jgi:tetratricopeptide (TPR) repeat protein
MGGWVALFALLGVSLVLLRLLGVRGGILQLAGAALLFGAAGYAWQGRPGLAGANRGAAARVPPIPLAHIRQSFDGSFNPNEHWHVMAASFAARGDTADAVGIMRAAVAAHPRDPSLWVGLGNALVDHAGVLTPPAQLAYERAVALSPDYAAPRFFLGLALARSGDRNGAIAQWHRLLRDTPAQAGWRPLVEDAILAIERPQAGS